MPSNLDVQSEAYNAGLQRAKALKGFYSHLATYVVMMTLLAVIDYLTGATWWVVWPMIGWGMAIVLHALGVFVFDNVFGSEWADRKAHEYAQRHR